MNTDSIITVLLAAASVLKEPASAIASQALADLYAAAKYYLRRKFSDHPDAARALDFATEKPASTARKATLIEEAQPLALERDHELVALMSRLEAAFPTQAFAERVSVAVEGKSNQVNVAGGDLVVTSRVVRRNAITPDERHLAREQRAQLLDVIHELAARLGGRGGPPNPAAVHRMLQHRFDVVSYLLIPRERYAETLNYLRQQRAIHRGALRRRDPAAFRHDLFRSIFARATELGWPREKVYAFAKKRLGLAAPIASLKPIGPRQLETLAAKLRRIVPPGFVV